MRILHIDSAHHGDQSVSRELTKAIVDHFTAQHPDAEVARLDLSTHPLPHMDPVTTGSIRRPLERPGRGDEGGLSGRARVLEQFQASDVVVIGAPMYNFTIPSTLKAWIDRLGVPRVSFRYTEFGPEGLLGGRRVIIVLSRGGHYEVDAPAEHHESYLRDFFGFVGIDNVEFIKAERIGFGPDERAQSIADAKAKIATL